MDQPGDRRRFVRFPAALAVLVRKLGPEERENLAKTRVLGLGGCLLVHSDPLGLEETVELLLSARGRVLRAGARVAYQHRREDGGYDIGVEFLSMPEQDLEELRGLLGGASSPEAD